MRPIELSLKERLLLKQMTAYNNANPSMEITAIRPQTAIFHKRFWQESIVSSGVTAVCTSVAVRRTGRLYDRVYIAYVDSAGLLTVKSAALVFPISNMAWTTEETIAGCAACALEFDGTFVKAEYGKVEYRTGAVPWLFYVTTGGELLGGLLGSVSYDNVSGTVTSVDVIRGVRSRYGDNDQGLILFYVSAGSVYYKQLIDGTWGDQNTVDLAPANAVTVRAERTFDWRIVLQITDTSGALYEVFSKMAVSGWANVEYLSASVSSMTVQVHEINYADTKSTDENISVLSSMAISVLYALSPIMLSAENIANGDGDYGYIVRVKWDEKLFSVEGNEAAFTMTDSDNVSYGCTAVSKINDRELELTFQNFNNAVGAVTIAYTPGTMMGEVIAVSAGTASFTPSGLVPFAVDPPVPVSAYNTIDWEA